MIEKTHKINDGKMAFDVVLTQEDINGKIFYVAQGVQIDVASQGLSEEEALENVKDAAKIVLEDSEDIKESINSEKEMTPTLKRVYL
jgi:predicted RNase H-like HicB family nuclease